jgi:hypothetical protein
MAVAHGTDEEGMPELVGRQAPPPPKPTGPPKASVVVRRHNPSNMPQASFARRQAPPPPKPSGPPKMAAAY